MGTTWRPSVALRDSGAGASSTATLTNLSVEETVAVGYSVNISAVLIHPKGEFAICGKDDGSVTMYEIEAGTELMSLYQPRPQCLVRMLAWCDDGQTLTCVDASNMVTAWRLGKSPVKGWYIEELLFQTRLDCSKAVIQILASQISGDFLLSTRETDYLWSVDGRELETRMYPAHLGLRKWIDHPQSPNHLICLHGTVARYSNGVAGPKRPV